MASADRERIKKARGAVLALFDKSLRKRAADKFAPKKPEPKPAEAQEDGAPASSELADEDAELLAAEYGKLGE